MIGSAPAVCNVFDTPFVNKPSDANFNIVLWGTVRYDKTCTGGGFSSHLRFVFMNIYGHLHESTNLKFHWCRMGPDHKFWGYDVPITVANLARFFFRNFYKGSTWNFPRDSFAVCFQTFVSEFFLRHFPGIQLWFLSEFFMGSLSEFFLVFFPKFFLVFLPTYSRDSPRNALQVFF